MSDHDQSVNASIADALHSAAIHLLRRARRDDPESGVAPAQLSALSVLVYRGALTLGQLATAEQVSPPSMSRTIDELERHGLVRRARDKHDRRVVYAVATREGARLLKRARQRRLALIAQDISDLSNDEQEILATASRILNRMMAPDEGGKPDSGEAE